MSPNISLIRSFLDRQVLLISRIGFHFFALGVYFSQLQRKKIRLGNIPLAKQDSVPSSIVNSVEIIFQGVIQFVGSDGAIFSPKIKCTQGSKLQKYRGNQIIVPIIVLLGSKKLQLAIMLNIKALPNSLRDQKL